LSDDDDSFSSASVARRSNWALIVASESSACARAASASLRFRRTSSIRAILYTGLSSEEPATRRKCLSASGIVYHGTGLVFGAGQKSRVSASWIFDTSKKCASLPMRWSRSTKVIAGKDSARCFLNSVMAASCATKSVVDTLALRVCEYRVPGLVTVLSMCWETAVAFDPVTWTFQIRTSFLLPSGLALPSTMAVTAIPSPRVACSSAAAMTVLDSRSLLEVRYQTDSCPSSVFPTLVRNSSLLSFV
jgi:hypothetical protein